MHFRATIHLRTTNDHTELCMCMALIHQIKFFAKKGWTRWSLRSLPTWHSMILWILPIQVRLVFWVRYSIPQNYIITHISILHNQHMTTCYRWSHYVYHTSTDMYSAVFFFNSETIMYNKITPLFQFLQVTTPEGWLDFFPRQCFFLSSMMFWITSMVTQILFMEWLSLALRR